MNTITLKHECIASQQLAIDELHKTFQIPAPYTSAVFALGKQDNSQAITFLAHASSDQAATVTAWQSPTNKKIGYLGLLHANLAPLDRTLQTSVLRGAIEHLERLQVKTIFAPVDRNIWFHYRTSLARSAERSLRPWEPPYSEALAQDLKELGFAQAESFHTTGFESREFSRALTLLKPSYDEAIRQGLRCVSPDEANLPKDYWLPEIYRLTDNSYCKVDLYEPITYDQFQKLYDLSGRLNDLSLTRFLLGPDNEILGYLFAFPDQNFAVIKTLAVQDKARTYFRKFRTNASSALLYAVLEEASLRDMRGGIAAMLRDGASSRFLEKAQCWAANWVDRYALWRRDL